jgi:hypothetical protein
MRLEACIRKGLRLKSDRVREVREDAGRLVAEIEAIEGFIAFGSQWPHYDTCIPGLCRSGESSTGHCFLRVAKS